MSGRQADSEDGYTLIELLAVTMFFVVTVTPVLTVRDAGGGYSAYAASSIIGVFCAVGAVWLMYQLIYVIGTRLSETTSRWLDFGILTVFVGAWMLWTVASVSLVTALTRAVLRLSG